MSKQIFGSYDSFVSADVKQSMPSPSLNSMIIDIKISNFNSPSSRFIFTKQID